jgi:Zn-dependent M28 family amino/carboxypeptidase
MSLGAKHVLVCADLTQHTLTEIDQALLDCDKQHMSCKDVFSATAAAAPRPALLSEELKLSSGKAKKNPIKDAFVATVDELGADGRYNSLLAQLSGASRLNLGDKGMFTLNTRYTMSTDNTVAAEWLSQAFISHESDDVSDQYFNMPGGTTTANVISTHYGSDPAKVHEIVVIGAHMDSTSRSAATNAPGAVDNGSGTIGALLLGEAIRKANFSRTVQVVAFSGEEQGIYGSAHYVAQAAKKGDTIVGALIMDMISYSNRYFGVTIEGTTSAPIQALMKQVEGNLNLYSPALTVNLADFSFGSDHVPFQRAGIPCVLAIEQDDTNYFGYHQTTDVVANSNASQAMAILRGFGGALYDLAN